MRLFISIPLPEELLTHLKELQILINDESARLRFVNDFHLTLKFLGEVGNDKLAPLKEKLSLVSFTPFDLQLDAVGVFPDTDHLRVIWAGVTPHQPVVELQQQIDAALSGLFPKDDRFHPHITLARVAFVKDKVRYNDVLKNVTVNKLSFPVNRFDLMESTLTPGGPVYGTLFSFQAPKAL
ncbi:RNA 2',3'-cyclic phosphodiesterase [Candidatus Woesearchaeota archaeon]|nr:RNA 2',3'-cyclic phosphodiesterase [Candidatus Woesearchaeota archaeon]